LIPEALNSTYITTKKKKETDWGIAQTGVMLRMHKPQHQKRKRK
jgi:hypothetical protein